MRFQAEPYNWPKSEDNSVEDFAVIVIDMQNDYCSPDCYMDKAGYDVNRLRKPINPIQSVLNKAREYGIEIIYTRHSESLDAEVNKENGTSAFQSFGWQIVDELKPYDNEMVFNKTTISAFLSGGLHEYLQKKKIKNLIFCGNTIDVCVHSSLRVADDFGYECMLLEDCCSAVNDDLHKWSVESVKIEDGVFGAVSDSQTFVSDLNKTD